MSAIQDVTISTKGGALDALRRGQRAGYDRMILPRDVIDQIFAEIEDLKVEAIEGAAAEVDAIVRPSVMADAQKLLDAAIVNLRNAQGISAAVDGRMRAVSDLVFPVVIVVFAIGFVVGTMLA